MGTVTTVTKAEDDELTPVTPSCLIYRRSLFAPPMTRGTHRSQPQRHIPNLVALENKVLCALSQRLHHSVRAGV